MFLSDNETRLDLLNNRVIADAIVALIREDQSRAISIGVHGDWGAGKSSILLMVEDTLAVDDAVVCLTVNGWLFQGFEDAKVVLIEQIVQDLVEARPGITKVADAAKSVLGRVDWLRAARKAGGLAWTAFTGVPDPALLSDLVGLVGKLKSAPGDVLADAEGFASMLSDLVKDPDPRHVPEEIHKFRSEFEALLDAAGVERLVVLVDDLDRCLPKSAIDTLEAIRLFLWMPRSAFVVGADERMIEYAVREHFPDLPPGPGPVSYTRNYLEKLIQVPFRIPALGEPETRAYVTLLLLLAELGEGNSEFHKIVEVAKDVLNRPWESSGLERKEIESALGEGSVTPEIDNAIRQSAQLGRVLARGSSGNPRQIKRFLNSWLLRFSIAQQRGFGEMIQRDALAKLVLAESFLNPVFDGVAAEVAADPNGRSKTLAALEAGEKDTETPSWVRDEDAAREWARIEPMLGDSDLRPYVFITRDRRGRLSIASVGNPIVDLVARLRGTEMMVLEAESDVENLQEDVAQDAFAHLRDVVLQSADLSTSPDVIPGVRLLAKHHPALRPKLLELLGELPEDRLGTWVVAGWASTFDGDLKDGYAELLNRWSGNEANKPLASAAKVTAERRR